MLPLKNKEEKPEKDNRLTQDDIDFMDFMLRLNNIAEDLAGVGGFGRIMGNINVEGTFRTGKEQEDLEKQWKKSDKYGFKEPDYDRLKNYGSQRSDFNEFGEMRGERPDYTIVDNVEQSTGDDLVDAFSYTIQTEMSNSSQREVRKELAGKIKDEVFTINVEIDNMIERISKIDEKKLSGMSIEALKALRSSVQWIKSKVRDVNGVIDRNQ